MHGPQGGFGEEDRYPMATRSQAVTRTLRNGILNGEYAGGMRMNEIDLATSLGVSRTPIRGALSTLAAEGLLDYTPNSGYAVRSYSSKDIAATYEVRIALEALAARLAAERGFSDEERGQMHRVLSESALLVDEHQWTEETRVRWTDLNEQFHQIIHQAADNPYLVALIRKSRDVPIIAHIRFQWFDAEFLTQAHWDHVEIADAIFNRQPARAEALEREHIYRAGRRLVQQWKKVEAKKSEKASRVRPAA
ncbi:GntR family transcriptional regulator [Prosthecomicrobium hirschii]|uniref:GntR family transcriptional regulator n=2 Tax=Prosthecodimorpha hirschii TaxID=665126 RepID=UPI001127C863|nr:GntR family transcriptional regulator [Prosthecomicrobium hirschii]